MGLLKVCLMAASSYQVGLLKTVGIAVSFFLQDGSYII
jgi:hypothetical protein